MMKRIFLAAIVATFAAGSALAEDTCESKAVGKDGKALAGAAKTSFMKKCKAEACAPKAVSAEGKPLAGAAKEQLYEEVRDGRVRRRKFAAALASNRQTNCHMAGLVPAIRVCVSVYRLPDQIIRKQRRPRQELSTDRSCGAERNGAHRQGFLAKGTSRCGNLECVITSSRQ
ncbi:hypothetical protein ACVWZ6_005155 [Bradyrhizobium sp. GM6.1]